MSGRPGQQLDGHVCVVGGGLAGTAAAIALADAGARVTLLESRRELGGVASSIRHGDVLADTGQHVFLRCYTHYRRLLDRLGTARDTELQDRFTVAVLVPGRSPHTLVRSRLPAPLHLLPALTGYRLLSPGQRLGALRAAAALRRVDPDDPGNDELSFGGWLTAHGQSPATVRRLWDLIAVAALNVASRRASLALAARVFRTGLLEDACAGDIGRSRIPLSRLHGEAARRQLSRLGARVHTLARVQRIRPDRGGFVVTAATGELGAASSELAADAVVLAVPHRVAAKLVPAGAVSEPGRWSYLGSSPIVNVHLWFESAVIDLPFAAAVDSPTQWIFNRSGSDADGGQYLVVSLSAADQQITRPAVDLIKEQLGALAELLPAARHARIRDAFVTREPHATFRPVPGTRTLRPAPATALPGLALAGAWTATGWPDTMEGAVRSGEQAAEVVAGHLTSHHLTRKAPL
jgi:squalene-associated FAD-dependent desaturase